MAKLEKKASAIKLRKAGLSFLEIAKKLDISESTAGAWCREIKLTQAEYSRLLTHTGDARNKGRMIGARMNRDLREQRVKDAEKWAQHIVGLRLDPRDVLLLGIGLYWGEGAKGRKLVFTNSSPGMLVFAIRWFEQILKVPRADFLVRIYVNESHRDRYPKIKKFWLKTLDIPARQFYEPTYVKSKLRKVYENRDTYYGVAGLRIRRSTSLQDRILGLIKAVDTAGVAQLVRAQHS